MRDDSQRPTTHLASGRTFACVLNFFSNLKFICNDEIEVGGRPFREALEAKSR